MRLWRFLAALVVGLHLLVFPAPGRAEPIPDKAYISGVVGYPQRFTLSCESRSAVDWAAFWGVNIREKKFLNSLPRSDNPDAGFVGNPNDEWGNLPPYSYGVHAEPVAALLRQFGLQAEARRDLSWDDLRSEIAAGHPVIVWVIGQMWRGTPVRYKNSRWAIYPCSALRTHHDPARVHTQPGACPGCILRADSNLPFEYLPGILEYSGQDGDHRRDAISQRRKSG